MAVDLSDVLAHDADLAARTPSPLAAGLQGSMILAIAAHVRQLQAKGREVSNFTIGDFNPALFPIPDALRERIKDELDRGQTHYPPAVGTPELRAAVRSFYEAGLGLHYPEGSVQVGAGARPPIFAAFQTLVEPGDIVVYPVPSWNIRYYVYLNRGQGVPILTRPETGFLPTLDDLYPHLRTARMFVLNSPLNPGGTLIDGEVLREICTAIVEENTRRAEVGERPLMLLYDQVYWQLVFEGAEHHTPPGLVPEMAKYTVLIDAISKSMSATGLRVGWAVGPPWLIARMKPLLGHMGAWAPRAEQIATAAVLAEPDLLAGFMRTFRAGVEDRLSLLHDGLAALRDAGHPVEVLAVKGTIYLTARFGLHGRTLAGRTIDSDEAMRSVLLEEAGVAVVPFTAFGYPENTGWVRFSVGAVAPADIAHALERIGALLAQA